MFVSSSTLPCFHLVVELAHFLLVLCPDVLHALIHGVLLPLQLFLIALQLLHLFNLFLEFVFEHLNQVSVVFESNLALFDSILGILQFLLELLVLLV